MYSRAAWRESRREMLENTKKIIAEQLALARLSDDEIRARAANDRSLPYNVRSARESLVNLREVLAYNERELADDSAYRDYVAKSLAQAKKLGVEP